MREKIAMLQDEVQQLNMDIEENQGTVHILSSAYRLSTTFILCPFVSAIIAALSKRRCIIL